MAASWLLIAVGILGNRWQVVELVQGGLNPPDGGLEQVFHLVAKVHSRNEDITDTLTTGRQDRIFLELGIGVFECGEECAILQPLLYGFAVLFGGMIDKSLVSSLERRNFRFDVVVDLLKLGDGDRIQSARGGAGRPLALAQPRPRASRSRS